MLNELIQIADYISYYWAGTTRHGLHSPFIYQFADLVLYQSNDSNFELIEHQRMSLLQSNNVVNNISLSKFTSQQTLDAKYGKLIQRIIQYYNPKRIIEVGSNTGIETNYLLYNHIVNRQLLDSYNFSGNHDKLDKIKYVTNSNFANEYQSDFFDHFYNIDLEGNSYFDLLLIHGEEDANKLWTHYDQFKNRLHTNSMVILSNIRLTNNHYINWLQFTNLPEVTASIELFQMGILFFRTEQLKQRFILRY